MNMRMRFECGCYVVLEDVARGRGEAMNMKPIDVVCCSPAHELGFSFYRKSVMSQWIEVEKLASAAG